MNGKIYHNGEISVSINQGNNLPTEKSGNLAGFFAQSKTYFAKKDTYFQPLEIQTSGDELSHKTTISSSATKVAAEQTLSETHLKESPENKKQKKPKKLKKPKKQSSQDESSKISNLSDNVLKNTNDSMEDKSARTVFIGNVSLGATVKDVKKFFARCGKVESVRLRSLPVAGCKINQHGNQKLVKKVCANKKILSENGESCNAYVVFDSIEDVMKAIKLNGEKFMEKTIRVDHENPIIEPLRSVFVGNLPFKISDDEVFKFFEEKLGEGDNVVENVRIIREKETNMSKGFCYVRFKNTFIAARALTLNSSKLQKRELRITACGKRFKNKKGEHVKNKFEGLRSYSGAAARIKMKRKHQGTSKKVRSERKIVRSSDTKVVKCKREGIITTSKKQKKTRSQKF